MLIVTSGMQNDFDRLTSFRHGRATLNSLYDVAAIHVRDATIAAPRAARRLLPIYTNVAALPYALAFT